MRVRRSTHGTRTRNAPTKGCLHTQGRRLIGHHAVPPRGPAWRRAGKVFFFFFSLSLSFFLGPVKAQMTIDLFRKCASSSEKPTGCPCGDETDGRDSGEVGSRKDEWDPDAGAVRCGAVRCDDATWCDERMRKTEHSRSHAWVDGPPPHVGVFKFCTGDKGNGHIRYVYYGQLGGAL